MPVVLLSSAPVPLAVFALPLVLLKSALNPVAVLNEPALLSCIALKPMAVFWSPVVLLGNASTPKSVFWFCACSVGESAKQTSAIVTRTGGMLVFISGESRKNLVRCRGQFAAAPSHRFQFQKRRQLFIRTAQRNAFRRRDGRQQSRSFVLQHPKLRPSPSSIQLCGDCQR